jgi:hypothetical protein
MARGSFPEVKLPGHGADNPLHLAPRLKEEKSYTSTPPMGLRGLFYGEMYLYITMDKMYRINNTYAMHSLQSASNFMQQTLMS